MVLAVADWERLESLRAQIDDALEESLVGQRTVEETMRQILRGVRAVQKPERRHYRQRRRLLERHPRMNLGSWRPLSFGCATGLSHALLGGRSEQRVKT